MMPEQGNSFPSAPSPVAQPGLCQRHSTSSPLVPAPHRAARQGVPCAVAVLEMVREMLLSPLLSTPAPRHLALNFTLASRAVCTRSKTHPHARPGSRSWRFRWQVMARGGTPAQGCTYSKKVF